MVRTSFERFEYKYFVPEARVPELRQFLAPFLVQDSFAPQGGVYLTNNLYFDSPDRAFYWAHVRSELDRFKLRVRWYGGGDSCFFEIKRKVRDVVVKHRSALKLEDFAAVLDGDRSAIERSSKPSYLDEWLGLALLWRAEPAYYIRYEREAYENVFDEDARITFDRRLCYQRADAAVLAPDDDAFTYVDSSTVFGGQPTGVLVELKFDRFPPRWLQELVRAFELRRTQFSKYLTAVDQDTQTRVDPVLRSTVVRLPWGSVLGGLLRGGRPVPALPTGFSRGKDR